MVRSIHADIKKRPLEIDPHLQARLGALTKRRGASLEDLAESVQRSYTDETEHAITEQADNEKRWQRYLETDVSALFNTVRTRLRGLAADAGRCADPR